MQKHLYLLGSKNNSFSSLRPFAELKLRCDSASLGECLVYELNKASLMCYEKDSQQLHARMPLCVFRPNTLAHLSPFIQICREIGLRIALRCGGTGLSGGCIPEKESVVLLTGHFKGISNYNPQKGRLYAEPGVTIRQINQLAAHHDWYFPLSMATEGVAGIAGCLSTHARGYHQQKNSILNSIESAILVDGRGEFIEAPAAMACSSEGSLGIVVGLNLRLSRKPSFRKTFVYGGTWEKILKHLIQFRSMKALIALAWINNRFYFDLQGDGWRLPSASDHLTYLLKDIHVVNQDIESLSQAFLPSQRTFVVLSSVLHSHHLPEACQRVEDEAGKLNLECYRQADVLTGTLHIILQNKKDENIFSKKIETFLYIWVDFLKQSHGFLASCHGIGMLMSSYAPLFWSEESQMNLKNLRQQFDPDNIFGRNAW